MRNKGLSFYKKKKKISQALLREIFSWIFSIALSVFLAGVIVIFLGRSARVVGMSMEPTLENGQQIYIDRFTYILSSPKAGDVVAFLPNGNENSHYYIKRVVAGPGDKVRIADGTLYVNGQQSIWVTERVLDAGIHAIHWMGMGTQLRKGANNIIAVVIEPIPIKYWSED